MCKYSHERATTSIPIFSRKLHDIFDKCLGSSIRCHKSIDGDKVGNENAFKKNEKKNCFVMTFKFSLGNSE